jgi:hypothetical protein
VGVPRQVFADAVGDSRGAGLELRMPRYGDRSHWQGEDNIVVLATAVAPIKLVETGAYAPGFDVQGRPVQVFLRGPDAVPYLAIHPPRNEYGPDAESVRAKAPKQSGGTIGGGEERVTGRESRTSLSPSSAPSRMVACDTSECGGGGGGDGSGVPTTHSYLNLPSNRSYEECVNMVLADPVDPGCKAELSWAFRPRLIFNWDEDCKTREPYWAVKPTGNPQQIEIFYAQAYWRDCGNRTGTADTHWGDSEFIIVRVGTMNTVLEMYPRNWQLLNVTLSAHYGWLVDDSWTGTWDAVEFHSGESRQRPMVYVSWGKHGNYGDVGSCGRGGMGYDDCGRYSDVGEEFGFDAGSAQDLGVRAAPVRDCVPSRLGRPALECFWTNNPPYDNFTGWTLANPYATNYKPVLGFRILMEELLTRPVDQPPCRGRACAAATRRLLLGFLLVAVGADSARGQELRRATSGVTATTSDSRAAAGPPTAATVVTGSRRLTASRGGAEGDLPSARVRDDADAAGAASGPAKKIAIGVGIAAAVVFAVVLLLVRLDPS